MGVCDIPMISTVCNTGQETASDLAALPFEWLATAMGEAAAWMFEAVWSVFDTTTLVDITSPGYLSVYNLLFGIAIFVMLIFFCLQLLTGLIKRDPTALARAAFGLAKSVIGSFVVITLTGLLLEIVDQLCIGIIQAAGETTETMGDKITLLVAGLAGLNITAPAVGPIVTIFLAGLAIGGAAIVWLSLLIRKALLLVAIVFAPLAFAGAAWDATKGWITKWAMFVIALIFSKLVVVVMFLVAISQLASPIEADLASISDPLAGIVLMLLAGFAPYLTYKFISFVGFDMHHAMSSEQEAKSALNRPIPTPNSPPSQTPPKVLHGNTSGTGASPGGGPGKGPSPGGIPATSGAGASGGGTAPAAGGSAAAGGGREPVPVRAAEPAQPRAPAPPRVLPQPQWPERKSPRTLPPPDPKPAQHSPQKPSPPPMQPAHRPKRRQIRRPHHQRRIERAPSTFASEVSSPIRNAKRRYRPTRDRSRRAVGSTAVRGADGSERAETGRVDAT